MGTGIRAEVSQKSRYYIPRHRYHELKHFCLQYLDWKKAYIYADGFRNRASGLVEETRDGRLDDFTAKVAEERIFYGGKMELVEKAAMEAGGELAKYILEGVTKGISFEQLKARLEIPCGKDVYYTLYRRFFWILSGMRG